jgi:DNA polymerase I-like protein with 3'-5' exonuclease and polymerase domains
MKNNGFITTSFGRQRRFDLEGLVVKESAMIREAINFPIQSLACDMHLASALAVYEETGDYPVQLVHDEVVYEIDREDSEDTIDFICWKLKKVAEEITGHIIPFPAELKGE